MQIGVFGEAFQMPLNVIKLSSKQLLCRVSLALMFGAWEESRREPHALSEYPARRLGSLATLESERRNPLYRFQEWRAASRQPGLWL